MVPSRAAGWQGGPRCVASPARRNGNDRGGPRDGRPLGVQQSRNISTLTSVSPASVWYASWPGPPFATSLPTMPSSVATQKSRPRPPCTMSEPESPGSRRDWGRPRRGRRSLPRDEIGPPPPAEVVGAGSPVDPIVAPAPDDPIVAAQPDERIVPVATADHVPARGSPQDVVPARARDRAPRRAGGLERPRGHGHRNDQRRDDADDGRRATAPVTRRCRRSPPSRGSARRSRRSRAW